MTVDDAEVKIFPSFLNFLHRHGDAIAAATTANTIATALNSFYAV